MADRLDEIRARIATVQSGRLQSESADTRGVYMRQLAIDLLWLLDEVDRHAGAHRRDLVRNANANAALCAEIDRLRAELDQSRQYRITEGVDR